MRSVLQPPLPVRLRGLDTLRALAIALVFAFHYQIFVSHESTFGWFGDVGWVGVDLFFVLSGYLIANQLFDPSVHLGRFYLRRAWRTVPAYLVMVALYFLLPGHLEGRQPPPLWRFLTFTQNLGLEPGTSFSHAWSLCIEEQFYLALPLVVLAATKWKWSVRSCWVALASCIALAIGWRSLQWSSFGDADSSVAYMQHIYYSSWCRIDELLPGVAVAMVKHFHPTAWRGLMNRGREVFAGSLVVTGGLMWVLTRTYVLPEGGHGYFMTAFGYSALAMCFAGLTVSAMSPTSPLAHWRVPGAGLLATGAYTIYLTHKAVAHVVAQRALTPLGLSPTSWSGLGAIVLASAVAGWVLHTLVEAPALRMRDRRWPLRRPAEKTAS